MKKNKILIDTNGIVSKRNLNLRKLLLLNYQKYTNKTQYA